MTLISKLLSFARTDILWVGIGQLVALVVGLLSLKIYTNLFTAEQYAFIALMMSLSAWIWLGLYQPLNQTIFRFYSSSQKQGERDNYFRYIVLAEKRLVMVIMLFALIAVFYGVIVDKAPSFFLLVSLSVLIGVAYGGIHGIVSFFMAQRKRKPVMLIQSTDGIVRLAGGLILYYFFSQTEYATASGIAIAGVLFLLMTVAVFRKELRFEGSNSEDIDAHHKDDFFSYVKKMSVVTLLNASIIHLDKWLLLVLLGAEGIGIYAALYMLAVTAMTVMYAFFEMLGFPLILNQKDPTRRMLYQVALVVSYSLFLIVILAIINLWAEGILLFLTTDYIAAEKDTFIRLVAACGLLNLGRIAMVQGQVDKQPHKYWPAYAFLLCFFSLWCFLMVGEGDGLLAAEGFMYGSSLFVVLTLLLNLKRKTDVQYST